MTDAAFIGPVEAPALHVMTYNIRVRVPHLNPRSPDRWASRSPLIARLLEREAPALIGVQEALLDQARFVRRALGPSYRMIGYGRRPNRTGEGCPIAYDASRLALVDWDQLALSDTPEVPGSSTWGNRDPRLVVRGIFRDRATGAEFQALNTHFDHRSRVARLESASMIRRLVDSSTLPSIVTGDFNTDATSSPHLVLVDVTSGSGITPRPGLRDTWTAAERRLSDAWGTFPDYRDPLHDRKRIDWILTSSTVAVRCVGINTARIDRMWPSDHTPVQAVVTLNGDAAAG